MGRRGGLGRLGGAGWSADRFGWWVQWCESSAHSCRAEFGVEFGDGFGDLFTGDLVADGLAVGVGGGQVGSGGHQRRLVFGGLGPLGDRFGVRCQPWWHWTIRNLRALSAHGGHWSARVDPQGTGYV